MITAALMSAFLLITFIILHTLVVKTCKDIPTALNKLTCLQKLFLILANFSTALLADA